MGHIVNFSNQSTEKHIFLALNLFGKREISVSLGATTWLKILTKLRSQHFKTQRIQNVDLKGLLITIDVLTIFALHN